MIQLKTSANVVDKQKITVKKWTGSFLLAKGTGYILLAFGDRAFIYFKSRPEGRTCLKI